MRLLILLCITLLPAAGCERKTDAKGPRGPMPPVAVSLRPVKIEPVQRYVDVVGTLWGDEDATISSKTSGRVVAIYKEVGDRVAPGEPLCQIAPTDYELTRKQKELAVREPLAKLGLSELPGASFDATTVPPVKRARLQADNAEARYLRNKKLFEQDPPLISEQDFADLKTVWDVAKSNYEVELLTAQGLVAQARALQADYELAAQRLSDTTVKAPSTQPVLPAGSPEVAVMAGERSYAVAARLVSVGEFAREGAPVFRLVDDDPLKLRATVAERYIREIKVGQKVRIFAEAYEQPFAGVIARINPQVDPANRTFQIEAILPNSHHQLKPGSFTRGRIETKVEENVVFVPHQAVISFAGVNKVFTVKDGKAVEHAVELGQRQDGYVEITAGLKNATEVVVSGAALATGVPVTIQPTTGPGI